MGIFPKWSWVFVLLGVPALSGSVCAAGANGVSNGGSILVQKGAPPAPVPCGGSDKDYHSCGQQGTYRQANAMIDIQETYIFEKIKLLKTLYQSDARSGTPDFTNIYGEIGRFCPDLDQTVQSDVKKCIQRYISYQIPVIRSMEGAKYQNNRSVLSFSSTAQTVGLATEPTPKKQQIPRAPEITDQQLQARSKMDPLLANSSESYNVWVKKMPKAPDVSEFYEWENKPDPMDPSSSIAVLKTDSKGQPVTNGKKYQQAMSEYQQLLADFMKTASTNANDPSPRESFSPGSLAAYQAARENFTKTVNDAVKKDAAKRGVLTMNFPSAPVRGPASGNAPPSSVIPLDEAPSRDISNIEVELPPKQVEGVIKNFQDPLFLDKP